MESVTFRKHNSTRHLFCSTGNTFQLQKIDETKGKTSFFEEKNATIIYFSLQGTVFNWKKMTKPNEKCHFSKKYNPHNIFYSPGLTFHLKKVDETKWKVSFFEKEKNPQYIFRSRDHFSTWKSRRNQMKSVILGHKFVYLDICSLQGSLLKIRLIVFPVHLYEANMM